MMVSMSAWPIRGTFCFLPPVTVWLVFGGIAPLHNPVPRHHEL
jgi:hypothetical protein